MTLTGENRRTRRKTNRYFVHRKSLGDCPGRELVPPWWVTGDLTSELWHGLTAFVRKDLDIFCNRTVVEIAQSVQWLCLSQASVGFSSCGAGSLFLPHCVQTSSGAHPFSCLVGTGACFCWGGSDHSDVSSGGVFRLFSGKEKKDYVANIPSLLLSPWDDQSFSRQVHPKRFKPLKDGVFRRVYHVLCEFFYLWYT